MTFGLSGVDMTSGDIKVLQDRIAKLLSGVESAFVTSLGGIFYAATKKTFADIQTLLAESETFLQRVVDAGNSLSQAAAPVKESSAQLTRNLFETAAQMNTLATANQTTRENLAVLSERLATFTKNFNGIANELERSTNIIRDSLDNYNGKISDGLTNALTQFDKFVNTALGGLNELLEAFNDTVGYVKQKRR